MGDRDPRAGRRGGLSRGAALSTVPVVYDASGDSNQEIAAAISSARPARPIGTAAPIRAARPASPAAACIPVSITPGATALTRYVGIIIISLL